MAALAIAPFLVASVRPAPLHGQEVRSAAPESAASDSVRGQVVEEFLTAFNRGSYDALESFFAGTLSGGEEAVADAASYWLSVFHELGPVRTETIDRGESPPMHWVRGVRTGGWAGFRFAVDSAGRITQFAVRRGVIPEAAPKPPFLAARDLPTRVFEYFESLAGADLFSGAILVAREGVPIVEGAWGWADQGLRVPNHLDTRFDIASVTKTFTAVAIVQLAEAGALTLDDPLQRWLPELPESIGATVTIGHLLTHTSGIELDDHPPYNEAVAVAGSVGELLAAQVAFIEHLNEGRVEGFRPSGDFDYSNENFDLLGAIVERASGRSWAEVLREEIFEPAGMLSTGVDYSAPVPGLATRYSARFPGFRGVRRAVPSPPATQARPAGGAYTTVGDLLRFATAVRNGTLLGRGWWSRISRFQVVALDQPGNRLGYGYGFEVERRAGLLRVGHAGGSTGVSARMHVYPELGYTVILLSNYDRSTRHPGEHLARLLASVEFTP